MTGTLWRGSRNSQSRHQSSFHPPDCGHLEASPRTLPGIEAGRGSLIEVVIRAYFDRNVFQDLYEQRRGISAADVVRLRSAIRHSEVDVTISITVLEETLAMWGTNPRRALAEVRATLDVVGQLRSAKRARVVKEAGDLLNDDIRAYAAGKPSPEPYVTHDLSRLLHVPMSNYGYLDEFIRDQQRQKESFHKFMDELRSSLISTSEPGKTSGIELAPDARRGFIEYFDEHAGEFARHLADRAGVLRLVEARMSGLLDLRSARMAVGANLSLAYSELFGNRGSDIGDSRDIHHAICATAADAFVTNDGPLAVRLQRIPALPVQVFDLPTLLARIGRRHRG